MVRITKVKGHADQEMVLDGRFESLTGWVTTLLMRLLTLVVGGFVICLGSVGVGTLLFLTFIDFSLPFLELWSIMMIGMVQHLLLLSGLLVLFPRGVALFMQFGIGHFFLGLLGSGMGNGVLLL